MNGGTRLIAGRYAVIGELGRGGMGVVWRAEDRLIGRQVALKELSVPPGGSERVLREARTAGRLNDPSVVTVYDVLVENGSTFVVMELVEAPTLADVMASEGALSEDRVAAIGLRLLTALEAAHAAGIVHRDVKPSNVMVLQDGRVKLADFGIARAMDDPGQTTGGGIMGSPGYMAPELFYGSGPAPASDLWSLGATLFHAVEGRAPFHRDSTAATMHAIMYEEPRLARCQGPLASVIMGLLTQSADTRLTTGQVRGLLSDGGDATVQVVRTRPSLPVHDAFAEEPKPRRNLILLAGAAALVVVLVLAAIFLFRPEAQQGLASAVAGTSSSSTVVPTTSSILPSSSSPTTATSASKTTTTTHSESSVAPAQPAQPARSLLPLTRFHHPTGWHFSGTSQLAAPAGFTSEGTLGSLAANAEPGTKKLYSCKVTNTDDRFSSIDQSGACEHQQAVGVAGFIFTSPPSGAASMPLYRCNGGASHFDSLQADCEGKFKEFMIGYVLS